MSKSANHVFTAGAAAVGAYIEDVFSTYLYTGTGSTQSIVNNIDLATEGGLTWIKCRTSTYQHSWFDTARGATKFLQSNTAAAETTAATSLTTFNTTGFSLGAYVVSNSSGDKYTSWTFRKQPKFFDIVTYTGTGSALTLNHNLGTTPGCIMVKCNSGASIGWYVWHRGLTSSTQSYLFLETTSKAGTDSTVWNNTAPTSTQFSVNGANKTSEPGVPYVAYIFAHDAGGFGLTGSDNAISCGSYTGTGSGSVNVNLGYEPQWLLIKQATGDNLKNWWVVDNMRGMPVGASDAILAANLTDAEISQNIVTPTATGFEATNTSQSNLSGVTYIYIAIRRGPMKVPTDATKVFQTLTWSGNDSASRVITGLNFPADAVNMLTRTPTGSYFQSAFYDKLRGIPVLATSSTQTEAYWAGTAVNMGAFGQSNLTLPSNAAQWNVSGSTYAGEFFQRAPSFFDEVCYTGTGINTTVAHSLGVAPELIIVKNRSLSAAWEVYSSALGNTKYLVLNTFAAPSTNSNRWNNTSPTSTVFSVGTSSTVNDTYAYVAYLFATCPGVSKVGSYTGTATTKQVDCGFAAGARYVLIKRTDGAGSWYVWDTVRGIISGNDPYLLLNSYSAEVTNTDYIDPYSAGFEISSTAPDAINANGGSYIFLAIA